MGGNSNVAALILYFSRKGYNYVNGTIKNLSVGNTEVAAQMICKCTGAELFKIDPCVPYSEDYSGCLEEAMQDQKRRARPELKAYPEHLAAYDTIYLGYPNWWGTMTMPVFTLLGHCGFLGKTIKPFCTHEGSGLGTSEDDIRRICPGVIVKSELGIHGANVILAGEIIDNWL